LRFLGIDRKTASQSKSHGSAASGDQPRPAGEACEQPHPLPTSQTSPPATEEEAFLALLKATQLAMESDGQEQREGLPYYRGQFRHNSAQSSRLPRSIPE